jgi:hypothetical protein
MIPPFHTVDHRIGPSFLPHEERRVLRRSAPERLRFDLPSPGAPILRPATRHPAEPMRPSRLRAWLGRRLIAWGHRLASSAQGS